VLFTDIVGSTERAAALGDRRWREALEAHHAAVRGQLARFRGREIDTAGDGFLATFDGPARAVLADTLSGIAVHTGARVASLAAPGEVLVSSTVKDLVAGSGLRFRDRGSHVLRGVPGTWQLFAVEAEAP
jgi:class 3 adenylate cyclase